jgi:hypothetical protein
MSELKTDIESAKRILSLPDTQFNLTVDERDVLLRVIAAAAQSEEGDQQTTIAQNACAEMRDALRVLMGLEDEQQSRLITAILAELHRTEKSEAIKALLAAAKRYEAAGALHAMLIKAAKAGSAVADLIEAHCENTGEELGDEDMAVFIAWKSDIRAALDGIKQAQQEEDGKNKQPVMVMTPVAAASYFVESCLLDKPRKDNAFHTSALQTLRKIAKYPSEDTARIAARILLQPDKS